VRVRVATGVALVVAGCGDAAPPRAQTTARAVPSLVATAEGTGDVVVARVDERPVWGSCVAAQAKANHVDAHAALDQCIELELAAQEAERRGLAADPDVALAHEQALASRFVEVEFSSKMRTVADVPAAVVDEFWKKYAFRMHRQEYRGSYYARVVCKEKDCPPGSPQDLAAKASAEKAYARLAGRKDLFPADLDDAVNASLSAGQTMQHEQVFETTKGPGARILPYYHEPLFEIPAIGMVAPPAHGPYGWDIILWTSQVTPREWTREQVLEELLPSMRVRAFMQWTSQLGKAHGARPVADDATLRAAFGGDE
jgi:hypothetical protein